MLAQGFSPGLIQHIHLEWGWEAMKSLKLYESCVNMYIFLGTRVITVIALIKVSVLEALRWLKHVC